MNAESNEKEQSPAVKGQASKLGAFAIVFLTGAGKFAAGIFKIKGVASILSMLLSVLAYWWTNSLGLSGALLFVGLLFLHELGHLLVARYQGLDTSLPMFIPFVGALISLKEMPKDAGKEAWMALGGPILGSIAALACLPVYQATGDKLWIWGATIGFMINLFNLLPMSPLDGGRIIGSVWRGFWVLGAAGLLALALLSQDVLLLLIFIIGLTEIEERYLKFKVYWWLVAACASVGIACLWANWWVLALTFLLALTYWTRRRNEKKEKQYREQLLAHQEVIDAWLARHQNSLTVDPEILETVLKGRASIMAELIVVEEPDDYYNVAPAKRFLLGIIYVGLAAGLGGMLVWVNSLNLFQ